MKIGVVEWTIRQFQSNIVDFCEAHKKLRDMGVTYIQGGKPDFMTWEEYKAHLDEYGLVLLSVGASYDELRTDIDAVIARAKLMGVKYVGTPTIPAQFRICREEGYKKYAKFMKEAGDVLRANGLDLQYHCHAIEFVNFPSGKTGTQILLEESGMQMQMDTHWVSAGGADPAEWIEKSAGRIPIAHYKDYGIADWLEQDYMEMKKVTEIGGVYKRFAAIGYGNINWPAVVEACKKADVEYCLIEIDFTLEDPFKELEKSIENMKKWGLEL